jgi:hypothetical protein
LICGPDELKEKLVKDGALDVVPPLVLHENETVRTGALTLLSNLSTVGPVPSSSSYSPPQG